MVKATRGIFLNAQITMCKLSLFTGLHPSIRNGLDSTGALDGVEPDFGWFFSHLDDQ